ncbi:hypothetical protein [Bacillus toyonensis]|uniref:hypothetical protein n=1 Tax=Bacillus toyonensis TaxID=155322 RepID=UPI000B438C9B|nr:hypothetical protein [Bacillus toyonensis]OTX34209.1 hypothetical protein BK717_16425 [Bacillus thuringiensis serovar malayensis]OUB11180.1 hypothetical protein BK709_04245 [Bacillus thuringiensis serovar shandongiensis]MBX0353406.1 hypothetical protein [Bacillus toyonensis]MDM5255476.1 hypothetical protein [Bacillus toyonensis]MEC2393630.1 hypothetical protein [Bacillus toyonensis]
MNKNPFLALVLGLIPGLGHLYLKKFGRFILYSGGAVFLFIFAAFCTIALGERDIAFLSLFLLVVLWAINLLDLVITIINPSKKQAAGEFTESSKESERFYIILLSIIPGLGHFQLGLMQRGLTFLVACTGIGSMIIFVALLTSQESFLIFLVTLPVLWIYNFFDVVQQLQKKERGEQLDDRTIFEEFEEHREQGKKNKTFASILAMFPGAGHMYLGLQRRGLQLMAAFLLSIYLLDLLRLSAFLFLVPIIWFYSFFDALQQTAKYGKERVNDEPIIDYFINHQRWIGIGLIVLGGYYLLDQTVLPILNDYFATIFNIHLSELYYRYFQTSIVALLLIGGGFKLLLGNKENKGGTNE